MNRQTTLMVFGALAVASFCGISAGAHQFDQDTQQITEQRNSLEDGAMQFERNDDLPECDGKNSPHPCVAHSDECPRGTTWMCHGNNLYRECYCTHR